MASYDVEFILTLTDANGDTAQMRIPNGDNVDTVTLAALAANVATLVTGLGSPGTITNAKVTSQAIHVLLSKASPTGAVDSEFSSVTDGARLNFLNSAGGRGSTTIPAPVPGVFGTAPNEDVVDPTGPVSGWITAYESVAKSFNALLNVYNGGVKVGRHARRRAQHKVA